MVIKRSSIFETLIAELNKLPGIGRKSAERLAYHILTAPDKDAEALASAVRKVKEKIFFCSTCFNLTETDPCPVCSDPARDRSQILVVEEAIDIAAFERSGVYKGLYHVLQGKLAPIKGVTPEKLRIEELIRRIEKGDVKEVIIATNPDVEGDATALYISRRLSSFSLEITRIGLGIPMGGALEYADPNTLEKALEGRKKL